MDISKFDELLSPLKAHPACALQYARQRKECLEMNRSFRTVEELYASAYAEVVVLEEKMRGLYPK